MDKGKQTNVSLEQEHTIILTEEEKATVYQLVKKLPPLDIRHVNDQLLTQVELVGRQLPSRVVKQLIRFRRNPNRYGTLRLRNLPTDRELPATPRDGRFCAEKASFVSEYSLLLFMLYFGDPIAYEEEKEGLVIQNICPIKGHENRQENTGSNHLQFHTEDGFHPYKLHHLALYCLRSDHEQVAQTVTASIINVLHKLPSSAIMLLRKPLYRLHMSSSFKHGDNFRYSVLLPVLSGNLLAPEMCIHYSSMEAVNREAQWALDTLRSLLLEVATGFVLLPGDLLIVDNRVAAHARTPFKPRYDGTDRWLQRMFTIQDIRRSSFSRVQGRYTCTPLNVESYLCGDRQ